MAVTLKQHMGIGDSSRHFTDGQKNMPNTTSSESHLFDEVSPTPEAGELSEEAKEKLSPKRLPLPAAAQPEKQPLLSEGPPPEKFPVELMGKLLGGAAKVARCMSQAPLAICGSSVLAVAALVTQAFANVATKSLLVAISLYFVSIAESGERKSTVDRLLLDPVREKENADRLLFDDAYRKYEIELAVYERIKKKIININDAFERGCALEELGPPPEHPLTPTMIMSDPTVEGVTKALQYSRRSIGIFSDEGGKMWGGYGMSRENILKTAAFLSQGWDGSPIEVTRSGSGQSFIDGWRIGMHLMVQPKIGFQIVNSEVIGDQGLNSRLLITKPESTIGTRFAKNVTEQDKSPLVDFYTRLEEILSTPPPLMEGSRNALDPRVLPLSEAAESKFIAFHDEVELAMAAEGKFSGIRPFANKAPEQALRLAGVLTLFDDLNASEVTAATMESAIGLIRFYMSEALRINSIAVTDRKIILAESLLTWAKKRGKYFSLVDTYQRGPTGIRQKDEAREIIAVLVDHQLIRPTSNGMVLDGTFRREVYEVL